MKLVRLNIEKSGKIRHDYAYERMKQTKKEFRSASKYFKNHEQQIRDNELFGSISDRNNKNFQEEANNKRQAVVSDVEQIDRLNAKELTSEMLMNFFAKLLEMFLIKHSQIHVHQFMIDHRNKFVSMSVIKQAKNCLKYVIGFDGIHNNHLMKLNDFNLKFIEEFLKICIRFSYMPIEMLYGVIKPRIKN